MVVNGKPATRAAPRNRARRGMVAVIRVRHATGTHGHTDYEIGVVTSVTYDGWVKRYRDAWGSEVDFGYKRRLYEAVAFLVPDADPVLAMEIARAHHWPGHPGQPQPFRRLDEVRIALEPSRRPA